MANIGFHFARNHYAKNETSFTPSVAFHEALKHLVHVDPDKVGLTSKRRKEKANKANIQKPRG